MSNLTASRKNERVNLLVPQELVRKAVKAAKGLDSSLSELVRMALSRYLENLEREKTEKEVADACKYYYEEDKKIAKEWAQFETTVWDK